jgi:hypothetical protein
VAPVVIDQPPLELPATGMIADKLHAPAPGAGSAVDALLRSGLPAERSVTDSLIPTPVAWREEDRPAPGEDRPGTARAVPVSGEAIGMADCVGTLIYLSICWQVCRCVRRLERRSERLHPRQILRPMAPRGN